MAVDKKSDYVGNHGGAYTDENGMSRQFTYVDHDKKPTISTFSGETEKFDFNKYRESIIKDILLYPASICPSVFVDYTLRGEGKSQIEWNTDMLIDTGIPINQLRDLNTLLSNTAEFRKLNISS